jgi:hypothetical protein
LKPARNVTNRELMCLNATFTIRSVYQTAIQR